MPVCVLVQVQCPRCSTCAMILNLQASYGGLGIWRIRTCVIACHERCRNVLRRSRPALRLIVGTNTTHVSSARARSHSSSRWRCLDGRTRLVRFEDLVRFGSLQMCTIKVVDGILCFCCYAKKLTAPKLTCPLGMYFFPWWLSVSVPMPSSRVRDGTQWCW